jgi:hypothetical protein
MSDPAVPVSGEDQPDPQRKPWDDDPLYGLDPLIKRYVQILVAGGVETFESCQGGAGHVSLDPFVRFHGDMSAGWHALSVVLDHALPVLELMREWPIVAGEPRGPYWRLTFRHADPGPAQTFAEICESEREALPDA